MENENRESFPFLSSSKEVADTFGLICLTYSYSCGCEMTYTHKNHLILWSALVSSSQCPCHNQNRLNSTQTPIIVVLRDKRGKTVNMCIPVFMLAINRIIQRFIEWFHVSLCSWGTAGKMYHWALCSNPALWILTMFFSYLLREQFLAESVQGDKLPG